MISPGPASCGSTRSSASVTYSSLTVAGCTLPSARHQAIGWPARIVPVAHPAQREAADVRRRVEVRDVGLERVVRLVGGRGDARQEQSSSGSRSAPSTPSSREAQPARALV